jgi:hypothetical protein
MSAAPAAAFENRSSTIAWRCLNRLAVDRLALGRLAIDRLAIDRLASDWSAGDGSGADRSRSLVPRQRIAETVLVQQNAICVAPDVLLRIQTSAAGQTFSERSQAIAALILVTAAPCGIVAHGLGRCRRQPTGRERRDQYCGKRYLSHCDPPDCRQHRTTAHEGRARATLTQSARAAHRPSQKANGLIAQIDFDFLAPIRLAVRIVR